MADNSQQSTPPPWNRVGRHRLFPQATHDEVARFNFITHMNNHMSTRLAPAVHTAWEKRVKPGFVKAEGRAPESRHEVRKAMQKDSLYQLWSSLRRNTMEMRQQAGREVTLRQFDQINAAASELNEASGLELNPEVEVPNYLTAADTHCMPGSYYTELEGVDGDCSAAANYDVGIFATTGGMLGRYSDGGGQAVANWLQAQGCQPKRILDLGCGMGHNIVPVAQAYPDAEVVAMDVAAPMLRYGAARALDMGVENIRFIQANVESLAQWPDGHFDVVVSAMFFHETAHGAIQRIWGEIHRLLADDGVTIHLEQPQYQDMDLYEQFMRDWDTYNNNEPFWSAMHDIDLQALMTDAGFAPDTTFFTEVRAAVDEDIFPAARTDDTEDYGRTPAWTAFGARKVAA